MTWAQRLKRVFNIDIQTCSASAEIDDAWPRNGRVAAGWSGWFFSEKGVYTSYTRCLTQTDISGCIEPIHDGTVSSRFYFENIVFFQTTKHWSREITEDSSEILSHIVPARTTALGSTVIPALGDNNLQTEFTSSNQDHSAMFHGYYSQPSPDPAVNALVRARYWNLILDRSLNLDVNVGYTDLANGIGVQ